MSMSVIIDAAFTLIGSHPRDASIFYFRPSAPPISLYSCSFGRHRRNDLTASASSVIKPYAERGANNGISTRHRRDPYGFFHDRLVCSAFRSAWAWRQDVRQRCRSWAPHIYLHRNWRFSYTISFSVTTTRTRTDQDIYFHINSARSLFSTLAVYIAQPMTMTQRSA